MNTIKLLLRVLMIGMLMGVNCFQAQSAKEVISKNIELTGGLKNWKKLNTVRLMGRLVLDAKETYPLTIYQSRPNLTRTVIKYGGKEVTLEGYDGKKGYSMNYASGQLQHYRDYTPESFDSDFIDYEHKGFHAQVLGTETIGNRKAFKVQLTKNTNTTVYYFDTQTYMLLKEDKAGETLQYTDYKKVGNYLFPFRIEGSSSKNNTDFVMIFTKIETNLAFDAKTYKF